MKFRQLGRSGLRVSAIGLGTGSATFVGRAGQQAAVRIVEAALDVGITYFDTAETYAEGRAEELLGKALKRHRCDVVIATKFGKDRSVTAAEQRGSRTRVMKAIEGSLRRLDTDYIDLYVMHEPDPATPIEETLQALDDLRRAGKVRYIACSDFPSWQIVEAAWTSRTNNITSFVAAGAPYNLLNRRIESDLVASCVAYGVGVVPTFPLAGSFLTGKYRRGEPPPDGSRFATVPQFSAAVRQDLRRHASWLTDANFDRMEALERFAQERGHTLVELAIAWLLSHRWLGAVPVGVTSIEQLRANVGGVGWELQREELEQIDALGDAT